MSDDESKKPKEPDVPFRTWACEWCGFFASIIVILQSGIFSSSPKPEPPNVVNEQPANPMAPGVKTLPDMGTPKILGANDLPDYGFSDYLG